MEHQPSHDGTMSPPEPFRFLDLPAELRTLVYEEVAYDTHLTRLTSGSLLSIGITCNSLLQTCKLIRKEYEPILLNFAELEFPVADWQFRPTSTTIARLQDTKATAKSLEGNDRIFVTIAAEVWTETHLLRVEAWLKARLNDPAVDIKYTVWRPEDGFKWKSKSQFLWMTGVEELRQLRGRLQREDSAIEVGKIISALEVEAENVAKDVEAATQDLERKRRALQNSYGMHEYALDVEDSRWFHKVFNDNHGQKRGGKKAASRKRRKLSDSAKNEMLADLARGRLQGGL